MYMNTRKANQRYPRQPDNCTRFEYLTWDHLIIPDDMNDNFTIHPCNAETKSYAAEYESIVSDELPNMKLGEEDDTLTLVLCQGDSVLAGITFRVIKIIPNIVFHILAIAVRSYPGVCGQGHGTRLVNYVKKMCGRFVSSRRFILAQVDISKAATNFWKKMKLRACTHANMVTEELQAEDTRKKICDDNARNMVLEMCGNDLHLVDVRGSKRAQEGYMYKLRCSCEGRASAFSQARIRCDSCETSQHVECEYRGISINDDHFCWKCKEAGLHLQNNRNQPENEAAEVGEEDVPEDVQKHSQKNLCHYVYEYKKSQSTP